MRTNLGSKPKRMHKDNRNRGAGGEYKLQGLIRMGYSGLISNTGSIFLKK